MAITLPSDIVLDVTRAVDVDAQQAARARLRSLAGPGSPAEAFAATAAGTGTAAGTRRAAKTPESFVKFEAMVLQTFVERMLPQDAENVYGSGLSGQMWKSFMAQEMATEIAKRGGIGIADRILGHHYRDGDAKVPVSGVDGDPAAKAAADGQASLSVALVEQFQRRIVREIGTEAGASGNASQGGDE